MKMKHSTKKVIYWVSFLLGFQRVIVFTDDKSCAKEARKHCEGEALVLEVFLSLDGVRLSVVNQQPSEIIYLGISSATSLWEVEKSPGKWKILDVQISSLLEEAWRNEVRGQTLENDVEVDFETMSMTKPYRGKLNRRYEPGLWVHYCSSISYESFSVKVNRVQVDNQIFGTLFPCALYPSPLPVSISRRYGFKPFCEISAIYRNDPKHSLLHLRYFKVLIQEMNVKLEKDFLLAIYKMLYGDCTEEQDEEMPFQENLRNISLTLKDTLTESDTQRLFLEHCHLSPLKINLSISMQSNLYRSERQKDHESDLFQFLVNSVGAPLTEVNDVLIKLACFERSGLFVTQGSLVLSAKKHYTWQALRQFHAIVLGLDVLGNPYGLLTDLQEGVKDFFYEPYQGIVLGPQEFASGIVRGVKSLLGHAIGGTTGAMSKITGTFGQAFASLSFDDDYRMKRRLRMGSGPTGIQDGVTMAGKSLFMGIVFGVSGVVTKPIQGARAEGVEGFFKGFGKGILGLVTRPTVGVFDMVTTTLDGIKRSAEQAGEHVVVRLRIDPRFSPPDAPLRPYLAYQANGNCILKSLPRSNEIINDVYVDHVPLPKEGHASIALFTNARMMEVRQTVFWSEWKINVDLPYDDINDSAHLIHGAMVIMRKNGECVTIESTDETTLQVVRKKLEDQLYHYRTTR